MEKWGVIIKNLVKYYIDMGIIMDLTENFFFFKKKVGTLERQISIANLINIKVREKKKK